VEGAGEGKEGELPGHKRFKRETAHLYLPHQKLSAKENPRGGAVELLGLPPHSVLERPFPITLWEKGSRSLHISFNELHNYGVGQGRSPSLYVFLVYQRGKNERKER